MSPQQAARLVSEWIRADSTHKPADLIAHYAAVYNFTPAMIQETWRLFHADTP